MIASTFLEVADILETGQYGRKSVIGFALEGNEHGQDNIERAMKAAEMEGLKAVLIEGEDLHKKMGEVLDSGGIDGAVTVHYPLPISVSTVGKAVIPGKGKPMHVVITTGASDTDRISGMVRSTVYGIVAAKADGVENPTAGIANIGGIRQTEKALLRLVESDYDINPTESVRVDGGIAMRGNDLLGGTPDIMIMDSLTGNLMMKVFSSYITDGNYESLGFGYGPGVGEGHNRLIMVVSRAFGAPTTAGAVECTINLIRYDWRKITDEELEKASKIGLKDATSESKPAGKKSTDAVAEEMKTPSKKVVTSQTPGIEVTGLEDIAKVLWKVGIYARGGMGCIGPIVLMSDANRDKARETLKTAGYVS